MRQQYSESKVFLQLVAEEGYLSPCFHPKPGETVTEEQWRLAKLSEEYEAICKLSNEAQDNIIKQIEHLLLLDTVEDEEYNIYLDLDFGESYDQL